MSLEAKDDNYNILFVLLEGFHEGSLLGVGLEPSVTELGGGIYELEVYDLESPLLGSAMQHPYNNEHVFRYSSVPAYKCFI